jgi:hypothetical protein
MVIGFDQAAQRLLSSVQQVGEEQEETGDQGCSFGSECGSIIVACYPMLSTLQKGCVFSSSFRQVALWRAFMIMSIGRTAQIRHSRQNRHEI